jgi:hypothetical protein
MMILWENFILLKICYNSPSRSTSRTLGVTINLRKIYFIPLKFEMFFNLNPIFKNLQCTSLFVLRTISVCRREVFSKSSIFIHLKNIKSINPYINHSQIYEVTTSYAKHTNLTIKFYDLNIHYNSRSNFSYRIDLLYTYSI